MTKYLGLVLAAIVALAATPVLAQAYSGSPAASKNNDQPKATTSTVVPKIDMKIDPKNHDQGMKDAPAAITATGVKCDMADAYYISEGDVPGADGKAVKSKIYEVACKGDLGQILIVPSVAGPTPGKHYDCISITASANLRCRLPSNLDPKIAVATIASTAGRTCKISDVRGIGTNPAGDLFLEVACSDDLGYILKKGADGKNVADDCARTLGTNAECKMTTKAMIDGKLAATVASLAAKSGKTCQVSGQREVGIDPPTGGIYYEVACGPTGGFIALADKQGGLVRTIDCAKATGLAGGCTLTDATVAQTQEIATYTKLAKASGFPCQVTKYHYIGLDTVHNSEVVELACSDHADGGIAVLPVDNSPGHVYDCVRSGALGQTCHLTDPTAVYDRYTASLAAKGKGSCKVSNAHWVGHSASANTDLIETACSDGLPGWVVVVDSSDKVDDLLSCGQAKASGIVCTLPGNTK